VFGLALPSDEYNSSFGQRLSSTSDYSIFTILIEKPKDKQEGKVRFD
jgi:hypothetical protein